MTTTWTYDYTLGVPLTESDPNDPNPASSTELGNTTISAQYDIFGRMTKLIRPGDDSANPTVAIDYHDTNPFWTEIRQRIDTTRYATIRRIYDGIGRPTKIEKGSSPAGAGTFTLDNTVSFQYPTLSMAKQSMAYASGGTAFYTTKVTDVLGRPLTITAPNGNATSYAYDGLAATITDPKGNSTTTTTDAWGRVITVTPPTGPGVTYTYDVLNNLKTATRGGVTTEIKYDYAGRKIGMDDPDMGMAGVIGDDLWGWTYEYDGLGNLTRQTDARGCVITLGYDLLNRLTTKTSSGAGCNTQVNTTFAYDTGVNGKGRRTSMNDGSGSTSWQYDARGRAQSEVKTINGAAGPFTTSWLYNSADLPISMTYPDNETLTYAYNNNGLLDTITSSLGNTYLADTQYDEAGRITSMDYGASVLRKTFDYFAWNTPDQGGLLQYAKTKRLADNVYLQDFAYDYDENANIETILDNQAGPQTQTFGYDALNRLTSAVVTGGTNGLYNEAYTYNASTGNLASKAGVNYTYDENHVHAVAALSNDNTYQYDENGNMTDRNVGALTFDLAYDAENRLVSVTGNGTLPTPTPTSVPPTATNTPSATPTITNTPTVTATQTPGGPTPTSTPTPTATATHTPGGPTATVTPSVQIYSSQPDATSGVDTYLLNTSPTTNNGTAVVMWVGESNNATNKVARSLIKFDLSAIPANATVLSATLSLWTDADFSDNDRMMRVYRLKAQFDESQATWNESATGVSWQSPGAAGADDRESADIGSIQILANETLDIEKQISLSAAQIQEMVNGTFTNNGFIIAADTELDDRFNYRTSDASAATKRPKLVIQYTLPQGKAPSNGFTFVNYSVPKVVQQSGSLNFTPADDAYIASGSPTSNYGSATTLQVDNSPVKHFLLKFDVAGINSGQVTSAKLCLYNVNSANEGGDFYRVADNSWQEETVTWNNAPAADTNLVASLGSVSPNTWYEVDLTSLITADGIYSLRVSDSVGGADYSSKEGSNSPKLLVSVEGAPVQSCAPAATATATPGPTNTPTLTATPGPSPTPTNISTATLVPTPTATVPPSAPFNNATFVYDGDGRRVKSTLNGSTTTYFVGNHYEVTGSTITKYYYAGAQRIAMRTNGTLNYLLGDHLGSTSLTTNASGQVVSELRYKAWGEVRYASGDPLTKYQYTGQYSHASDFGLLFYNARWLDPSLGRFAQADTTITGGVQGLDRYAYVNNSPLMYVDPTGHVSWPIIIGAAAVLTVGYTSLHLFGVLPDYRGTRFAKNYVTSKDPIVGAGIAVQSEYYGPWDTPSGAQIIESFTGGTSNIGIAQSSNAEMERLEIEGDPMNNADAVAIMTERIHSAQNACNGCNSTDLLIIAAMAQNGDLTAGGVGDILRNKDYRSSDPTHTIDWSAYFINGWQNPAPDPIAHLRENITGRQYNTRFMLGLYVKDLRKLLDDGWALPSGYEDVNWKYINDLQTRPSGRR